MKTWLILSLLAVFGLAAPSDMAAVVGQDEVDSMLIGRNMANAVAKIPTDNLDADTDKNNLRKAAATTTPYSQSLVEWDNLARGCAPQYPSTTVTISCATGGVISLVAKYSGVSTCTKVGTNTLKCTSVVSASAATVAVKCTGKYSVTATLPKFKFTGCKSSVGDKVAYQDIYLAQRCAIKANVKNYTNVYSKQCGVASQLHYDPTYGRPTCLSVSKTCVKATTTTCAITTDAVKISTPATTNALCILK